LEQGKHACQTQDHEQAGTPFEQSQRERTPPEAGNNRHGQAEKADRHPGEAKQGNTCARIVSPYYEQRKRQIRTGNRAWDSEARTEPQEEPARRAYAARKQVPHRDASPRHDEPVEEKGKRECAQAGEDSLHPTDVDGDLD
jgi:hypothetical protein